MINDKHNDATYSIIIKFLASLCHYYSNHKAYTECELFMIFNIIIFYIINI